MARTEQVKEAAVRDAAPLTLAEQGSPRFRFARRQLVTALLALEAVDRDQFDHAMRCLELEDRLDDSREELERMRESRDVLARILNETGDGRVARLNEALRVYAVVGK